VDALFAARLVPAHVATTIFGDSTVIVVGGDAGLGISLANVEVYRAIGG
jgi:hypothetical protein